MINENGNDLQTAKTQDTNSTVATTDGLKRKRYNKGLVST
jgi:hypothetical protein